jgi:hypothetical protein
MRHSVFSRKASAWLLTALMMFFGEETMANSLKLADPSELAGNWLATLKNAQGTEKSPLVASNECLIDLQPNQTLGAGADCFTAWLGEQAIGWFPEPDGIAITGNEGSKILFLSRQYEGLYQGTLQSGRIITLKRPVRLPQGSSSLDPDTLSITKLCSLLVNDNGQTMSRPCADS